jgi:LEA14-like dessication related protein
MAKDKKSTINVQGTAINILSQRDEDFISLTDMVKHFEGGSSLIEQWLKHKNTVLFLAVSAQIYNPNFNSLEFAGIKNEARCNSFFLSAKKWQELTGARGLVASAGRCGGTYDGKDQG